MVTEGEGGGGMVELGGGLPALPPRPVIPQRQINATMSVTNPLRVPNVHQQAVETQPLSLPSGSDLGVVGKIGVYQLAHTSGSHPSSSPIHYFWIYSMIALMFIFVIKK
ncbi:hypothetical protein INT47_005438 [Mucor saturninus]|uniref:Uncharacterized protein n=1 Tax=Mucor saturninus TaxID=64648 RepID=A0A8H7RGC8_9FUNG|nr:hypothetical protein INT47_005438 [Mucor saturninus]